jgi:NitT/TauT family transport system substrate-binding protein
MSRKIGPLITALVLGGLASIMSPAHAAEKVRVTQAGSQLYRLPMYVALLNGYFKDENLDVEIVSTSSGSDSIKMMVGGAVEFEDGPPVDLVNLRKQQIEAKAIAILNARLNNSIIVPKAKAGQIRQFSDLKGKTVGMTGVGSGTWQVVAALAKESGIDLDSVSSVAVGSDGVMTTFLAGRLDALSYVDPEDYLLLKNGDAVALVDFNDPATHRRYFGDETIFNQIVVMESYAKAHPAIVQSFVNGLQKALTWISQRKPEDVAALMKTYEPFKDVALDDLVGMTRRTGTGFPKSARISQPAFDSVMKLMTEIGVLDKPLLYGDFVDNSYADKAVAQFGPDRRP